jgi:hypothetical protein
MKHPVEADPPLVDEITRSSQGPPKIAQIHMRHPVDFHQHTAPKLNGRSASRIHQHQPKIRGPPLGTIL